MSKNFCLVYNPIRDWIIKLLHWRCGPFRKFGSSESPSAYDPVCGSLSTDHGSGSLNRLRWVLLYEVRPTGLGVETSTRIHVSRSPTWSGTWIRLGSSTTSPNPVKGGRDYQRERNEQSRVPNTPVETTNKTDKNESRSLVCDRILVQALKGLVSSYLRRNKVRYGIQ